MKRNLKKKFNKKILENVSFIYLANPNQPSGNIIKFKLLEKIINKAKKIKNILLLMRPTLFQINKVAQN